MFSKLFRMHSPLIQNILTKNFFAIRCSCNYHVGFFVASAVAMLEASSSANFGLAIIFFPMVLANLHKYQKKFIKTCSLKA